MFKSIKEKAMNAALTVRDVAIATSVNAAEKTGAFMWDTTKKGLTTAGKVTVGAAVAVTTATVVYVVTGK
jgi:hypothetical protein